MHAGQTLTMSRCEGNMDQRQAEVRKSNSSNMDVDKSSLL